MSLAEGHGNGKITEVVLYPHGATVTRTVTFEAKEGIVTVVVEGIPEEADPERISMKLPSGLSLVSMRTEKVTYPVNRLRVEELKEKLRRLEAEQRSLQADLEVLKERRQVLLKLKDAPERDFREFFAFISEGLSSLRKGQLEVEEKLLEVRERISAVKRELEELAAEDKSGMAWKVEAVLQCSKPGRHTLSLLYPVFNASWKPFYTADLQDDILRLRFYALVEQRSGEDWPSISLAVSTGRPLLSTHPPEPVPWYVWGERRLLKAKKALVKGMEKEMGAGRGPVESHGPVFVFKAGKATIPATGKPVRLLLRELRVPVKLSWKAVPSRDEGGYLMAEGKNNAAFPLLPGEVLVAVQGALSIRIPLPYVAPGGELKICLGRDERVRAKKELLRTFREDVGFGGKRERLRYHYRITVSNHTPEEIVLELRDPLPVSKDERVKVKIEKLDPPPKKRDERGIGLWEILLPPHEKKVIDEEFYIEKPKQQ